MADTEEMSQLRQLVVDSCRMLASTEVVREVTGHVSVRIPGTDEVFVRCRRDDDPGVEFTTLEDVCRVDLDGKGPELERGLAVPGEWAIHSELYRARPDVGAVVHGHPRSSLLCGVLELELQPIFGAYDPGAMELAVEGVPVFPRAVLISTPELGRELAAAMGKASACLLAGHGIVTTGADVQEATVRAIKLETLAEVTVQAHAVGRKPNVLSDEDVEELQRFMARGQVADTYLRWTWDFYRRTLEDDRR